MKKTKTKAEKIQTRKRRQTRRKKQESGLTFCYEPADQLDFLAGQVRLAGRVRS